MFYWIYNLPNWQLAILTILVFVGVALGGLFVSRPLMRRLLNASPEHNDIASAFFAGVGVFYGLALGLIAVGTWENFSGIVNQISREAAAIAELYRDFDAYPDELRDRLEDQLRTYTQSIVDKDWPGHRRGEAPEEGTILLDEIENEILRFEPTKEREKIAHAEVLHSLDSVVEQRRLRLESVGTGLPASLWGVVIVGAGLNFLFTYLFWVENLKLHALLIVLYATFIALLVFLTAAMDNPYRGDFNVSPDVFQELLDGVMKAKSKG
jgi:hypothetical protein